MNNLSTKLNLAALKHTRKLLKGASGEIDCLIIPIKENNLFIGDKGLYLDLNHFPIKNPAEGQKDSHLVKQSLPKELLDKMSDDEKKAMPILGNTKEWGSTGSSEAQLAPPIGEMDQLPF
jgi:hypothetical protein